MKPAALRAIRLPDLAEMVRASRDPADLETIAAECDRRGSSASAQVAKAARGRARALKAVASRKAAEPGAAAKPKRKPLSLVAWLVKQGGVKDRDRELHRDIRRARPALISSRGMALDIAATAARDAGYFPEYPRPVTSGGGRGYGGDDAGVDPMGVTALVNAIEDEAAGRRKRYPDWQMVEAPVDPDKIAHEDEQAAFTEAQLWRDLCRIAMDEGSSAAWHFIVDKGRIPQEDIPW